LEQLLLVLRLFYGYSNVAARENLDSENKAAFTVEPFSKGKQRMTYGEVKNIFGDGNVKTGASNYSVMYI
jgi:hypothetical protein